MALTINNYGQNEANRMLKRIKEFPIENITGLNDDVFEEAGRIKSKYKMPLGDSIVAVECLIKNGTLVTSAHDDFEKIKEVENIKINWLR